MDPTYDIQQKINILKGLGGQFQIHLHHVFFWRIWEIPS